MKWSTLQQRKEATMLCEEGMTTVEARNALLVPQNTKHATPSITHSNIGKTKKYCTNCGMMNHNVETSRNKKQQTTVATTNAAQPNQKAQKTSSRACRIYGLNGHKMIDCPKFIEMQKMVHGKSVVVIEVQHVVET